MATLVTSPSSFPPTKILGLAVTVFAVTVYLWDEARRSRRGAVGAVR